MLLRVVFLLIYPKKIFEIAKTRFLQEKKNWEKLRKLPQSTDGRWTFCTLLSSFRDTCWTSAVSFSTLPATRLPPGRTWPRKSPDRCAATRCTPRRTPERYARRAGPGAGCARWWTTETAIPLLPLILILPAGAAGAGTDRQSSATRTTSGPCPSPTRSGDGNLQRSWLHITVGNQEALGFRVLIERW